MGELLPGLLKTLDSIPIQHWKEGEKGLEN